MRSTIAIAGHDVHVCRDASLRVTRASDGLHCVLLLDQWINRSDKYIEDRALTIFASHDEARTRDIPLQVGERVTFAAEGGRCSGTVTMVNEDDGHIAVALDGWTS